MLKTCTQMVAQTCTIHNTTLMSNALIRMYLYQRWTCPLKSLTVEVPIFLLLKMIIFSLHSPEGKVTHYCVWKAIEEVLKKSCKAVNMSVELESANTNEKTLKWSESHFSSQSCFLRDSQKHNFLFISGFDLHILILFWNYTKK